MMKENKKFGKYTIILMLAMVIGLSATGLAQDIDKPDNPNVPIENLTYQAADIRSVIRSLADYGQVNVVVAPNVQGTVTINLRNVSWEQALKIIGSTYNLAVVFEEDDYIRIMVAEDYRKEQMEIDKHNQDRRTLAPLDVKILKLANTAAAEIAESVQSLMTQRGKVDADDRTNSLILQEVPENMDRVIEFIKELDRPAKQIKISTQILDINSLDAMEHGVDWMAAGTKTYSDGRAVDQTMTQLGDQVLEKFISYDVGFMQSGWNLDATISAILSNGKGKLVAHPEITTIDNKPARIQMGQRIPVKQFDESGNVVIEYEDVGTILEVTPHITAENKILMHLKPERSFLQPDASGTIINTNNAETNVVVHNGQTAVIGGLTTVDEKESHEGIPILKDLPVIGMLFSYYTKSNETRDLVIFVTPTIVDDDLADVGP